uniref:Uncharacterized protein n=1 Tax=Rhizophora mucronata TaxID=61149 RepID=A0A2P2K8C1_RHIMU
MSFCLHLLSGKKFFQIIVDCNTDDNWKLIVEGIRNEVNKMRLTVSRKKNQMKC